MYCRSSCPIEISSKNFYGTQLECLRISSTCSGEALVPLSLAAGDTGHVFFSEPECFLVLNCMQQFSFIHCHVLGQVFQVHDLLYVILAVLFLPLQHMSYILSFHFACLLL